MAPDTDYEIKEAPNNHFDVFTKNGKQWCGSFRYFADALKFAKSERDRRLPKVSDR